MLLTRLIAGFAGQDAPVVHPATPPQVAGHRSGNVQGTLNVAFGERATLRRNTDGTYDLVEVERIEIGDVTVGVRQGGLTCPLKQ